MSAPPADLSPPPGLDIPVPAGVRRTREAENVNLPSPMRRRVSDISVEEPLLEPPPSGQPSSSRLQPVLEEGDENERATPYPAEEDHASTSMPPVPDTPVPPQPHITQSISSSEHQEPETPPLPATTATTTQPPYPPPHPGEPEPDVPVPPRVSQVPQARPLERSGRGRTSSRSPRRNQNFRTPAEMLPYMGSGRVAHQISEIEPPTRGEEESSSSTSSGASRNDLLTTERSLSFFAHSVCEHRLAEDVDEEKWFTFLTGGWSGTIYNFILGKDDYEFEDGEWVLMAKRSGETDVKKLPEDEKKLFRNSDLAEWQSIVNTGAVIVHCGQAARDLRESHPSRVLSSRMVRRKKPVPGLHQWKAKSRWCVHGHTDPDLGRLSTYSPTPATESIMLFLQSALNTELRLSFADVKNAFCQSRRLNRAGGRLFAEPCEGLELPVGALIELVIPVYGLEDAPYEWRATVLDYLIKELKFTQNILEPCWLSKYDKKRATSKLKSWWKLMTSSLLPRRKTWINSRLTSRSAFTLANGSGILLSMLVATSRAVVTESLLINRSTLWRICIPSIWPEVVAVRSKHHCPRQSLSRLDPWCTRSIGSQEKLDQRCVARLPFWPPDYHMLLWVTL